MSTFVMQPSDIERKLQQQQLELQPLSKEMAMIFPVSATVEALRTKGNYGSGVNSCEAANSFSSQQLPSVPPTRHDLKVNPNFSNNSSLMGAVAAAQNGYTNQELQERSTLAISDTAGPTSVGFPSSGMNGFFQQTSTPLDFASAVSEKRNAIESQHGVQFEPSNKRMCVPDTNFSPASIPSSSLLMNNLDYGYAVDSMSLVPASEHGQETFGEHDVLSGRGGGTNVHPGNRYFRDLINLHRRKYLKARKNAKPAISRAIVRMIREKGGNFLKRCEETDLWFEIGDDAAREKTSQALRQRAPEMRKLLIATEEQLKHQQQLPNTMNLQNGSSNMDSLMAIMVMRRQFARGNVAALACMNSSQNTATTMDDGRNETSTNPTIGSSTPY